MAWRDAFFSKEIVLTPSAGAEVSECIKEAVVLAMQESCTVRFKHNASEVVVEPQDVMRPLYEQWNEGRQAP